MVQVSWSGSAREIPETCEEAYSPTAFPGASLPPATAPEELFFFPPLLRYLKILGFNLQLVFAEQKRKKYLFFSAAAGKKKSIICSW